MRLPQLCILAVLGLCPPYAVAGPTLGGQTGLVHMPDARTAAEGTWYLGGGDSSPYRILWTTLTPLPGLEITGRYTVIRGADTGNEAFGDYKDKAVDLKWRFLGEGRWLPALAAGAQDLIGTRILPATYLVASKRWRELDLTVGYGRDRIDGWFGGVRYRPRWAGPVTFIGEYDATDYAGDFRAAESGANRRDGGWTQGVEIRYGWLGLKLAVQDGRGEAAAHLAIPLQDREYIPKIHEPAPDTRPAAATAPPLRVWRERPETAAALVRRLEKQGFRNVHVAVGDGGLVLRLNHPRISRIGRAVGRAARSALLVGPPDLRELTIVYTEFDQPVLVYRFQDPDKLRRYFAGLLSPAQLEHYVDVSAARPELPPPGPEAAIGDPEPGSGRASPLSLAEGPDLLTVRHQDRRGRLDIVPVRIDTYLNDLNGVFRYDLYTLASYRRRLAPGLYLSTAARLTLAEDISKARQESNSLLPHVRSDVARYKSEGRLKLDSLLLNRFLRPGTDSYARLSVGYYEEMYAGLGGQWLYLPPGRRWAVDVSLDWLRQRDFDGGLGLRDYDTVTALAAWHYRWPWKGISTTVRAGRFLARDEGVRLELKRQFRSGIEFGGWYTWTNGNDVTPPGSPGDPYHDKGVFVSIPLRAMLTRDSRARAGVSLAPWTRDVGQMVRPPVDLYLLLEDSRNLDGRPSGPLRDLGQ